MNGNLAYQWEPEVEIIGGKLVMLASPTSDHNRTARNIAYLFGHYLRSRTCEYFPDREALFLEDDTEEYQPDGMVVCDPDKVRHDGVHGAPDLVVEVLSPSTARYDRGHKMAVYERHGVREYWIVSPEARSVEQYVLEEGKFVLRDVYTLYPSFILRHMKEEEIAAIPTQVPCTLFPDLSLPLDEIFYRVAVEKE